MEREFPETNIIRNIPKNKIVYSKAVAKELLAKPRPSPKSLGAQEGKKEPWDFNKSLFKGWAVDSESTTYKCFEFDWQNTKLPPLIKKPADNMATKTALYKAYKGLKEMYKYYAGLEPINNVPCIGTGTWTTMW